MNIPLIGEVSLNFLAVLGLAGACGFILGSQIRSGIKIILILFIAFFGLGLISVENLKGLVQLYQTLQPILGDFTQKLGSSPEPALLSFIAGFSLGLWKG